MNVYSHSECETVTDHFKACKETNKIAVSKTRWI